jgi:hypothetical protein
MAHQLMQGIYLYTLIYMPIRNETRPPMDHEHRDSKLKGLDLYLRGLPSSLAITESISRYNFTKFAPDPDWVEAIGSVEGAVNHELKLRLGMRANGPIECLEQGPPVEALVGVLDHYSTRFPHDTLLAKWIDNALAGATHILKSKHTCKHAIYQTIAIVVKTNVFDAVMQQPPGLNAAELNSQEHCQSSAPDRMWLRDLWYSQGLAELDQCVVIQSLVVTVTGKVKLGNRRSDSHALTIQWVHIGDPQHVHNYYHALPLGNA